MNILQRLFCKKKERFFSIIDKDGYQWIISYDAPQYTIDLDLIPAQESATGITDSTTTVVGNLEDWTSNGEFYERYYP